MQATEGHKVLDPISEASIGGGGARGSVFDPDSLKPRRSLRNPRPPPASEYQLLLRRNTAQPSTVGSHKPRRSVSNRSSDGAAAAVAAARLPNTCRTGPPALPFQLEAAETLLAERLDRMLRNYRYDPQTAPTLSRNLALEIKGKVKQELAGDQQRYKLIVLVTIAEPSTPNGLSAARALWSVETGDACARAEFRNSRIAASAAVFAIYCE